MEGKIWKYVWMKKNKNKTAGKSDYSTRRDKSKDSGEKRESENISRQDKTIQTKQDIPKLQKKILLTIRRRMN